MSKLTGFRAISDFSNNKMDPRLHRNLNNILLGIRDRYDVDGFLSALDEFREHVLDTDNPHDTKKISFNYTEFLTTLYEKYKEYNPDTQFSKTRFIQRSRSQRMFVLEVIRRIAVQTYVNNPIRLSQPFIHHTITPTPFITTSFWSPPIEQDEDTELFGVSLDQPLDLNKNTLILRTYIKNAQNTTEKVCQFINTQTGDTFDIEHDASSDLLIGKRNGQQIMQLPTTPKTTVAFRWAGRRLDTLIQSETDVFSLQHMDTQDHSAFDQIVYHLPFERQYPGSTLRKFSLYPGHLLETQTLSVLNAFTNT